MKNYNHVTKYFFSLSICLTLFSCATMQTKGSPIAGGQVIDMGIYEVEAPLGDGWKVKMDKTQGMTEFKKGSTEAGFTSIYILPGFLNPGKENHKIREEVYETDFTKIHSVISSFQSK